MITTFRVVILVAFALALIMFFQLWRVESISALAPEETLEEATEDIFERVSGDFSTAIKEIAVAIITAESHFRNECNKEYGCLGGIGLFQIVQSTFDEQCEGDVYDVEDNVRCGFKLLERGDYWRWSQSFDEWVQKLKPRDIPVACSCIKAARLFGAELPLNTNASELKPNTTIFEGVLALFSYDKSDHAATVTKIGDSSFSVLEGNYIKCKMIEREVDFNDPFLKGFYDPQLL